MPKQSAGIVLYRRSATGLVELLLVHPGGPFWARRDVGAWTIPKGECQPGEDPLVAARREFEEETGMRPQGEAVPLGSFRQSSAKTVTVWAIEGDFDPAALASNTFSMEWPPRSGRQQDFPEVDAAGWFAPEAAARKILKGQLPIIDALLARIADPGPPGP